MLVFTTIKDIKEEIRKWKSDGDKIGLVPTMGFLHEGHLTLMREAKKDCQRVIATIFVNPLQFGQGEDFESYPRAVEEDIQKLKSVGVDGVFIPNTNELYPASYQSYIEVEKVTQGLCGQSRPGHFKGVTTVVAKLFNITEADKAYFGLKDAQQVQVIRTMVKDLNMNIEVIPVPIVRESDGLAMSSRNSYLSKEERQAATILSNSLQKAKEKVEQGQLEADEIKKIIIETISKEPKALIDYVEIVNFETMEKREKIEKDTLIALAVRIGTTRLIDNMLLGG